MTTRLKYSASVVVVLVLLTSFFLLSPSAPGQDDYPTAAELLQQGVAQYEQGQLEQAESTLERVDRLQLSARQRIQLERTIEAIEARQAAREDVAATLAAAQEAENQQDLSQAQAQYRQVLDNSAAPRDLKAEALAGLARIEKAQQAAAQPEQPEVAEQPAQPEQPAVAEQPEPAQPAEEQPEVVAEAQPEPAVEALPEQPTQVEAQPEAVAQAQPEELEVQPEPAPQPEAPAVAEQPAEAQPVEEQPTDAVVEAQPEQPAAPQQDVSAVLERARTLRAQQLAVEGQVASQAGEYNRAQQLYTQALSLDPDNQVAGQGLENVQALLGREARGSLLGGIEETLNIRRQQALARYAQAIEQAQQALQAGNYAQAQDNVAIAKAVLDTNRQILTQENYTQLRQESLNLGNQIDQLAEQARLSELAVAEREVQQAQRQAQLQAERERQQRVVEMIRRAADLRRELKYDQAVEVLDQLLFIDPNNIAAQAMKEMIEDSILYRNERALNRARDLKVSQLSVEALEATVPPTDVLLFPPDWPQITAQRGEFADGGVGDSEVDRRVMEKLRQPIPVSFDGVRLENAVEYFRNVTNVNFFVNWRALEMAGIERDTPVTLNLNNVPVNRALQLVLDQIGGDLVPLGYSIDEGVVTISTEENLARNTVIRTYDIRDLIVQVPNFNNPPEFDLSEVAQSGGTGEGGGGGGGSIFGDEDDEDEDEEEIRLALTQQIMQLVRDTVDPDNWRMMGGLVSSMSELNGNLIVNTTPQNHREIAMLLSQLRETRALQIAVEARFLLVDQNFLEEIGFDADFALTNLGGGWGDIEINQNSFGIASRPLGSIPGSFGFIDPTDFSGNGAVVTGPDGGGFTWNPTFLNELQVSFLVRATQAHRRAISLSAPRVTFFNGQRAYVVVATQTAYISDLEPVVGTGAVGFDPEISVLNSGVVLDVEGTVSADRRFVTMTVQPSLAQINGFREFQIAAEADEGDGGDGDGGTGGTGIVFATIQVPELELTQVRTTVSVPDRGTLLLGGQRLVGDIEVEAGVPVLSKLPIINRLFSNRSTIKDERTLLILVKPTIIIQSEEEEQLFPGIQQGAAAFNAGLGQ